MGDEREENVYMAKLAEQAERYDGIVLCALFSVPLLTSARNGWSNEKGC